MGMFDYLRCEYPLPDGFDAAKIWFQTKDTDAQYLDEYEIRDDGSLWHAEPSSEPKTYERVEFHGALNFYTSNICGSGPHGVMTDDDRPPWVADYTALYDHGRLLKIEGAYSLDKIDPEYPWLSRDEWHGKHAITSCRSPEPSAPD